MPQVIVKRHLRIAARLSGKDKTLVVHQLGTTHYCVGPVKMPPYVSSFQEGLTNAILHPLIARSRLLHLEICLNLRYSINDA